MKKITETENIKNNNNIPPKQLTKQEKLIGFLLIVPIYMLIIILLSAFGLDTDIPFLFPILIYTPIIIGLILSFSYYKDKIEIPFIILIVIFIGLSTFFIHLACDFDNGWDGLIYGFFCFVCGIITKILLCFFYKKIVGWKKTLLFLGSYAILILLFLLLVSLGILA